jgi:hypothetical protein
MTETPSVQNKDDSMDRLIEDIYYCKACEKEQFAWCFKEHKTNTIPVPHKLPPIGALAEAKVIFVALNPRYSEKPGKSYNADLHQYAMKSLEQFRALARNIDNHGNPYIADPSEQTMDGKWEEFYRYHIKIIKDVYGRPFGEVALATEMFLCASEAYGGVWRFPTKTSPCAKTFLVRTIKLAQPEPVGTIAPEPEPHFVVTFGKGIPEFFARNVAGIDGYVIHLPFIFSTQVMGSSGTAALAVEWVISVMKALQNNSEIPHPDWTGLPQEVWKYATNSKPVRIV